MSKLLPPPKSKWREGHHQIGLFIRTDSGREVEIVWDNANKLATATAFELLHILTTGKRPPAETPTSRATFERIKRASRKKAKS